MNVLYHYILFCGFCFGLLAAPNRIYSQLPENPIGLTPSSLKWNQIHTDRVQVIFPEGMERQGNRVAGLVHYLWDENQTVGELNKKISVILHNQTTRPNGLVTPGPFRSEFYTRSPLFNCTSDWIDLLTIHEYQHVKQFANADQGLTKLGRSIFGSWIWGGFAATALPRWFWEGDATFIETAYTKSGRGRLPTFHMDYRALFRANRLPDYEKAGARSFREFIPDWYRLGYYINVYGRQEYGSDLWAEVLEDAVRYKGWFHPFSKSLRKRINRSTRDLYDDTMRDLGKYFEKEPTINLRSQETQVVSQKPKIYTHYLNPHFENEESIIALKFGFDHIPEIVRLNPDQSERRFTAMGIMPELPFNSVSSSNGIICWAENSLDPRWRYKNYSVIRTYDLKTGIKSQLTRKSKYFAPEINADASKILATEISMDSEYALVILDLKTGEELIRIPNPENRILLHTCWGPEEEVFVIVQDSEQHYLASIDHQGNLQTLSPPLSSQLSFPFYHDRHIYFSAAYQEIMQIYALDLDDQVIYQLTQSPIGAIMPSLSTDGTQLLFSEYTADGFQVVQQANDKINWNAFDPTQYQSRHYGQDLLDETQTILNSDETNSFQVEKFRKSNKLLQFHSLMPSIEHPIYGLSLLSDNKIGTMRGEIGGILNVNERTLSGIARFTYAGWYPEISLTALHRNRSASTFDFSLPNDTTLRTNFYTEEWSENVGILEVALPLRFQTGHIFHQLRLGSSFVYTLPNVYNNRLDPANNRDTFRIDSRAAPSFQPLERPLLNDDAFSSIRLSFSWQSLRNRARRHLNPHAGISTRLTFQSTLGDVPQSSFFSALANVYLPGFHPTHSFWVQLGYRNQSVLDIYRFPDVFIYTRGYGSNLSDEYTRASFNYSFPIAYPDIALGSLAFIQRVKLNLFLDISTLKIGFPFEVNDNLNSVGVDLGLDFRALRLLDVDLGLRYSYLLNANYSPNGSQHQFDFLVLSISG